MGFNRPANGTSHEPTPLPACGHPLPALRGEGRERGDQKRFMAPTLVKILEVSPTHEPPLRPRPRSRTRPRFVLLVSRTRTTTRTIGFMASMHVRIGEVFAIHEPCVSTRTIWCCRCNINLSWWQVPRPQDAFG